MKLKLDNYHSYSQENTLYNKEIEVFITSLLQAEELGPHGYEVSKIHSFYSEHPFFDPGTKERLNPKHDQQALNNYSKYKNLGPLEFSLSLYLLDRAINILILTGALGSGKSSLSDYVLNFFRDLPKNENSFLKFPSNGTIEFIDFNSIDDTNAQDAAEEFRVILANTIIALITDIHDEAPFIDAFIEKIKKRDDDSYQDFLQFTRKLNRRPDINIPGKKFDLLLEWLDDYDTLIPFKLRLLCHILRFIKTEKNNGNVVDFIIIFDNIDRLQDLVQIEVLSIIFSFSYKIPGIKILVPMRLTTLGKIKGNGSYNFSILENAGPSPLYIFEKRLKHFLNNQDEYVLFNELQKETKFLLVEKIKFIYNSLSNKSVSERIVSFFGALSGDSIRRGLGIAERFFLNSVIYYKEKNLLLDEFLKALLVSGNPSCKMVNDDRLVCNLFAGYQNKNSLLNIRILQIVSFIREANFVCRLSDIQQHLPLLADYNKEEILFSINELVYYTRKLLCIDGVNTYSDSNNLAQSSNDVIQITPSGLKYLNDLLYNPVFLQTCFCSLDWTLPSSLRNFEYLKVYIEKITAGSSNPNAMFLENLIKTRKAILTDFIRETYDFGHANTRMMFIRECLNFLLLIDLDELSKYMGNVKIEADENRYIKSSIVIDIIARISQNILKIMISSAVNNEEIESWYNLLLITDLWHEAFFSKSHATLERSIEMYRQHLKLAKQ